MIKINLVPQEILEKELQRQRAIQLAALASVAAVVIAGVSLLHYTTSVSLQSKLERDKKELDKLKVIVAQVEQLEQTAAAVRARLNVIEELLVGRPLYPYFMQDLVATLPTGLWILSLATVPEGSALKVNMSARALAPEDVSKWLRTFESSKKFAAPVISPLSIDSERVTGFTMAVKYNPDLRRR